MAAMIRVIGHQPRSMVERLAHIGSEREHAHQQFTRRDKGRCPRHGGPQGIECLLHLALAPQHFAQQAQRRRIAGRGAKALAQHGERLVQTPLAHGHGRAQQERIARSSLDALHFGLRSLPGFPGGAQLARKGIPGMGEIGLERDRAAQGGNGLPAQRSVLRLPSSAISARPSSVNAAAARG
jgi:hypothetical protein